MGSPHFGNKCLMRRSTNISLVPVSGDISVRTVPALRNVIERLIASGSRRIVLNMAAVPYVDSSGMAFIFGAVRRMRENGGLLSLVDVTPDVLRSLRIARLVDLIPVSSIGEHDDVPELDPSVLPLWRTTLPVSGDDLQAARTRVAELAHKLPFSNDEVFDITLAVGEALGNAADHTCGDGILATVSAYPDRMVVEVTDCGDGFEKSPEQMIESQSMRDPERGRGILLMRLLVDSVRIEPRPGGSGTLVRLVKLTS